MAVHPQDRYLAPFQRWSRVASGTTMLVGSSVLMDRWLNLRVVTRIMPGLAAMTANAALALLVAGLAVWLLHPTIRDHRLVVLRRACALLLILLGALTLSEYAVGWNLGIDQLLERAPAPRRTPFPGRLAPIIALNVLLLGCAFVLLDAFQRYRTAQVLILTATISMLFAGISSLYGVVAFAWLGASTATIIALPTASTVLILGLGMLFARPDQGWMLILTNANVGGVVARRLLPATILVPTALGWVLVRGFTTGVYDPVFGVALFASLTMLVFTVVIARSALIISRLDVARGHAEARLRQLSADLEARVVERTAQLTVVNQQLAAEVTERARVEAKFRALLDATPDALVIIDAQGVIVLVNAQLETLFGYPRDAVIGQSVDILVPTRFRSHHGGHRAAYFTAPRVRQMGAGLALAGLRQDGTEFPVEISLSPVAVADDLLVAAAIRDITVRTQMEAALHAAQARFANAFRTSPAALTITRQADSCFIDVNERFLNLFGYRRDEVIGRSSPDLAINTDPAERAEMGRRFRAQGAVHDYEITLRTKAGDRRTILLSADPLELDGEPHILTTMLDITIRKQTEAALQASEAKLRALFEVLPVGISILDRQRQIVDTNPALERILAISNEGLHTGAYREWTYIHPDGTAFPPEQLPSRRAFDEQRPILDVELGVIGESGQTVWTRVSAAPLAVGDLGVVVVTTDITERQRARAALTEERDLLQALMDHIPDTIYFKDTASRFIRINQAQARVLGVREPDAALGKTDADFQAPALAAAFHVEEQQLLATGRPLIDRLEFNPTPDGQARWFSATKVPRYDRHGRLIGLIGISRDMTGRIKAEATLQLVNAQLTERIDQMALLNTLVEQLQACVTLAEVYAITATFTTQLVPAAVGAVYVLDASRTWVDTVVTWGGNPPESQGFGIDACWALRRGQPHRTGTGHTTIVCDHLRDGAPGEALCLPLLAQGDTFGVLHLRRAASTDTRTDDALHQQVVRVVADSVALALANLTLRETLRQQSIRDPLTNLFNRRAMEEALERELRRAARHGQPVGMIMLDVDHFKQVNDTYGHDTGDAVLRHVGRCLHDRTRGGDIACRYGGEEFLLILPDATLDQTRLRAEQHRQDLNALRIEHAGQRIPPITVSCGVASYPAHGTTSASLVRAADAALYRAKHAGRDRVVIAE